MSQVCFTEPFQYLALLLITHLQEAVFGKKVDIAYRETVESEADTILTPAKDSDVAFLVVGDPFG